MPNRIDTPFTNEHFAAYCMRMVGQPYWYGTCGYKATSDLLARKAKQYPSHYTSNRTARYKQDIAAKRVVCDCIGGSKGYAWSGGGQPMLDAIGSDKSVSSKYGSNGCPDKGANSMFAYARQKGMANGAIGTMPEIVGIALYKSGHVGYYVGGGYAVEWRGFAYGCVKTKVAGRGWTNWYKLPFIKYNDSASTVPENDKPDVTSDVKPDAKSDAVRNLSYKSAMMRGEDVRALQEQLNGLGFSCGKADGIFGPKTCAGVKAFQKVYNLEADGIVGPKTRGALQSLVQQVGTESAEAQPEPDKHAQSQTEAGEEQAQSVTTEPVTVPNIRIKMTREENIAVYGADEVKLDIEEYLRGVVPSEMYESANIEALKAQAICARTYACYRLSSLLSDTANHQAFRVGKIGKNQRSDEAIAATRGMVLTYDGKLVNCFYCASNKGETKRSGDVWSTHYPYYVNKADEWDEAARAEANVTSFGHGVGLSQHGAMWAARHGFSYTAILAFYYEGCAVSDNYGFLNK